MIWVGVCDELQVAIHRLPVLLDNAEIAVKPPSRPGNNDARITPHRRGAVRTNGAYVVTWLGRAGGECAIVQLIVAHVRHLARGEGMHVHIERRRGPK